MMRLTKRVFSAFLAFVMVFTMLPLDAWADDVSGDSLVAPLAVPSGPEAVALELDQSSAVIQIGGTATFVPTVTMDDDSTQDATGCTWESDNLAVATVDNGVVTGVAEGTAKITCTYGELTTFAMVTVTKANYTVLYKSNYPSDAKKYIYTYVEENNSGKFTSVIETPNNTTYNETYNPGDSVTVAKNIFTTINYQLTGYKDVDTKEIYAPGQSLGAIDKNYTLEAQWEEIPGASTEATTIKVTYYPSVYGGKGVTKDVSATVQNISSNKAQVTFLTANIQDSGIGGGQTDIRGWIINNQKYEFNQQVTVTASKRDGYWTVMVYPWTESTGAGTAPAQFYVRKIEAMGTTGDEKTNYYSVGGGIIDVSTFPSPQFKGATMAGNDDRTTDVSGYIDEAPSAAQIANLMNLELNEAASVRWYVIKDSDNGYHVDGYVYSPGKYWKVEFVDPDSDRVVQTLLIEDQETLTGAMDGAELNTELRKFLHWSKSEDGELVDLSTIEVTQDIKLYAVFERYSGYTVEYYLENNGKYELKEKVQKKEQPNKPVSAEKKTYTGYELNLDAPGTVSEGTVKADGTLTLALYYDQLLYKVKVDVYYGQPNEGQSTLLGTSIREDITWDQLVELYGMQAYQVANEFWNVTLTGNEGMYGTVYWEPDPAQAERTEDYHVAKIYLKKVDIPLVVTVTYDGNGETSGTAPETHQGLVGDSYTIVDEGTLKKDGYEFTGWNTREDGSGEPFEPDTSITLESDLTLYAQWEQATATYTVQHWFEKVDSDEYEQNSAYGDQQFTGQIGQSTNATAHAVTGFTARAITQETIAASGTVVNVYYDRNKHDVTYTYTDAEGNTKPYTEANQTGVKFGATVTVADSPSVPQGYEFSGWTSEDVTTPQGVFTMPDKNVAFTGSITPKTDTKYTVEWFFEKVDGTYNDTPDKVDATRFGTTGQEVSVTAQDKEPQENYPNYVFDGENEDNVLTSSISGNGTTVLKLYFERNQFSVKYEYSGTVPEGANERLPDENWYKWGVNVGVDNTLAKDAEVGGYVFSGWITTDATVENDSFIMPQQDVTFTGSWTKLYTVTYDPNADDAEGSMDPDVEKAGTNYTIRDCLFSRTKYNFVGWNTKSDGTGDYLTGNIILNQDLILYAQWEKKEVNYTIEYYLDDELQVQVPYAGAPVGAKAKVDDPIDISNQILLEFEKDDNNYILDERADNELSITISLTESENVLKVYYASDNKGGEGDPDTPDDIPDKYQVIFRYVAGSNGSITGKTHETITKSDKVLTAQPTGTTVTAANGYKFLKWTRSTDNTEDNDEEMGTFTDTSYSWGSDVTFTVHFTKRTDLSYTIHHYLLGTTVKVAEDTTGTGTFQDKVTVEAVTEFLADYREAEYNSKTAETITITTGTNEATVYYKMPLTIKADDARRDYNGQPLTCDTFTVDGLVNGDNQNDITLRMTAESTITDAGWVYNVIDEKTVDGVKPYYEVTYEKGTLTIDPINNLVVTISGNQKQEVYNGQTQTVSDYTATFKVGNNEVIGVYDLEDFTYSGETVASGEDVETYTVELDAAKFTWNDTKNFTNVSFVVKENIVLTITPKPITVTAINLEMYYGKTVPTPEINEEALAKQLADGDEIAVISYTPYIDFKEANENKPPVGTYEIKFDETDGVQGNYNVTYVPATLTVNAPSGFAYVEKSHENGTFDSAGDVVTFNITVHNIYDVRATVELREKTGVTFIAAEGATLSENGTVLKDTLDPNTSKTYQATYIVTQEDLRNTKIENTVELTLTVDEDTITDTATDTVTGLQAKAILAVEKTVQNPQASYGPGETITYNIKVTNTGNQTLTDVTLTDTLKANEAVVGNLTITGYDGPFDLTPGEFENFTVTYEVKESDLGKTLVNTATATGKDPVGNPVTATDSTEGETTDTPSRLLEVTKVVLADNGYAPSGKDGNGNSVYALGDTIHYQITVTNIGNVALQNVTLEDVLTLTSPDGTSKDVEIPVENGATFTLNRSGLEGSSRTFDVYYPVEESDLGKTLSNVATATSGETEDENEPVVVQTDDLKPSLSVTKEADRTSAKVGETITYTIKVTNNGNQTLNNIVVTDPLTGLNKEIGTLKPGATSEVITTSYVVKASDLIAGTVTNTATAKAGNVEASGSKTVTITGSLSISVTLNSDEVEYNGQEHTVSGIAGVTYGLDGKDTYVDGASFTVGGTTFTLSCANGKGTATGTDVVRNSEGNVGSYPVTADVSDIIVMMGDQDVTDKVNVTNVTAGSLKITPREVTITVQDAEKTYGESDPTPFQAVLSGDPLVNDTDLGTITCSRTNENVNDAGVYDGVLTASYTANGNYDVTVVKGKFTINKYTLPVVVTIEGTSAEKSYTGSEQFVEGYTITGITVDGVESELYPETSVRFVGDASDKVASGTYVGEYPMALSKDDFKNGNDNFTNVTFQVTPGELIITPGTYQPVTKTHEEKQDGSKFALNETVTFPITVVNIYNTPAKVTLKEMDGVFFEGGSQTAEVELEAGGSKTFKAYYVITEQDILNESFMNTVEWTIARIGGTDKMSDTATDTVKVVEKAPKLEVTKSITSTDGNKDGVYGLNETITYSILVENTGNVTAKNITVQDILEIGDVKNEPVTLTSVTEGFNGELKPGKTAEFTYQHKVTQEDLGKTIVNTATATAEDPEGENVPSTPGVVTTTTEQRNPELKVVKTASSPKDNVDFALGETINYTITLTNTGNVTLNVSIRDLFGTRDDVSTIQEDITEKLICMDKDFDGTLKPEASVEYTYSYKVTEADLGKDIVNTVTYTAVDDTEVPAQQDEESVTEVTSQTDDPDPDLAVEKKVVKDAGYEPTGKDENGNDVYALGDTIHYQITVSNTGNVTLTGINVVDELKDSLDNVIETLNLPDGAKNFTLVPVGQTDGVSSKTFDVYYTVEEADLGKTLVNTVTATAEQTEPEDSTKPVESKDETDGEKTEEPIPNLTVAKDVVNKQESYQVGDVITYKITVTNTGNTTIHNVELIDHMNANGKVTFKDLGGGQMVGESPVLAALAPKTAWVVTCQYTVQLADADSDGTTISNKVTVNAEDGPDGKDPETQTPGEDIDPIYTLTIKYQNGARVDLRDPDTVKLHAEDLYTVVAPDINGYHLSDKAFAEFDFTMPDVDTTIVIIYARNPVEEDDDDPVVNPDNDPDETTEETEDEVDPGVYIEDPDDYTLTPITEEETPLADLDVGDHTCCIMHFLLMLAAMVVLGFYTDSKKKHQARIFELKRTLAMEKGKNPDGDNSQQS